MRVVEVRMGAVLVAIAVLAWWIDRRLDAHEKDAQRRELRLLNGNTELMASIYDQTERTAK